MILTVSTRRILLGTLTTVAAMAMPHAQAATITVTTVADALAPTTDGECSLREALANASNDAATYPDCAAGTGDDEIAFASNLFRPVNQHTAMIQLEAALVAGKAEGTAHALAIRPPTSISNPRRVRLVASNASPHRVMEVRATARPFTLEQISIEGGRVPTGMGAGIYLESQDARLQAVHFIDNQAWTGGALYQEYGDGELRISDSLFENNHASGPAGAIEITETQPAHRVFIHDTRFIGNVSGVEGGAIVYLVADVFSGPETPLLDIVRSRFVNNIGTLYGGGISVWAASNANQRLRLQISDSLFQGNQADNGGGLIADGHRSSTQSSAYIQRTSFIDNQAGDYGGGVATSNLDLHIENSLFSGNHAARTGGGLDHGGGKPMTLIGNSFHRQTLAHGSLEPGRTLALRVPNDASSVEWTLSGNLFDPAASPPVGSECIVTGGSTHPPTIQGGDNLSPVASCLFLGAADIHADPMVTASDSDDPLKPLRLLPQPGSPAIDAWPADACTNHLEQPLTGDLRDAPRPADGDASGVADCDIGAFELPAIIADPIFANSFE